MWFSNTNRFSFFFKCGWFLYTAFSDLLKNCFYFIFIFLFFFRGGGRCWSMWDLGLWSGIDLSPSALEGEVLNSRPQPKVPVDFTLILRWDYFQLKSLGYLLKEKTKKKKVLQAENTMAISWDSTFKINFLIIDLWI